MNGIKRVKDVPYSPAASATLSTLSSRWTDHLKREANHLAMQEKEVRASRKRTSRMSAKHKRQLEEYWMGRWETDFWDDFGNWDGGEFDRIPPLNTWFPLR
jgi:hypothetical protein